MNKLKALLDKKKYKVIKNVSASSNAFTFLCKNKKNNIYFYRKYSTDEEVINKLKQQLNWINENKNKLPLPEIINSDYDKKIYWYDMKANISCLNLYQLITKKKYKFSTKIFNSVLNKIKDFHKIEKKSINLNLIQDYIKIKVIKNINQILCNKYINELQKFSELVINGRLYKNLSYYFDILSINNLSNIFKNDIQTRIHGDLTLENIIYDKKTEDHFYFIDPNPENIFSTMFMDYAKLLQSLHGQYEHLQKIKNVKINENKINFKNKINKNILCIYRLYDKYLKYNFSNNEYKSIYYHEIVHWLRLLPYKIKKNSKLAVIFYCQTIILLSELKDKFNNK